MSILEIIEEIGISGILDIIFMSILIYSILVWFKRTRTAFVVIGMFIIGGAYLLARQLDMSLTTTVFQGFFAIILIAVVIIFQEEIKHFLEQLASRSFVRGRRDKRLLNTSRAEVEAIVNTANSLARDNIGALLVLWGKDPIVRHLEGGMDLDGEVSEPLLRSIFDPHSPGHDGAVIVRGNRVIEFGSHLPLSKNLRKLKKSGTRHAAALGLAELTDALCVVVSEEEGTISIARHGDIRRVSDAEELSSILEKFNLEITPPHESKPWKDFFKKNYREKAIAITVTVALWFVFVHESKIDYRSYVVPVEYNNVPTYLAVSRIVPREVEITFSGPRRSFYFVSDRKIKVFLKLFNAEPGIIKRTITRSNITFPEALTIENIQPNEVTVTVEAR